MSDDLDYVRARLPGYTAYDDEEERHDSDMRVRAFVGERLTRLASRLAPLDGPLQKQLDDVLLRCMFTDQVFVKKFEHAQLDPPMTAALVHADRSLVEFGERADDVKAGDAAELPELLKGIEHQLDYRRAPEPITAT